MTANDNRDEAPSARPKLDDDAWRFAESIIRERGPTAYEVVEKRIETLDREGNYRVAKLWRDVAEAIKWLQGQRGPGKS